MIHDVKFFIEKMKLHMFQSLFPQMKDNDSNLNSQIEVRLEKYIHNIIYKMITNAYHIFYDKPEKKYSKKIQIISTLSDSQLLQALQVGKEFWFIGQSQTTETYIESISTLKKIADCKNPIDKLEVIRNVFNQIENIFQNLNNQPQLSGDELLPIFLYILIRANIPNLHCECVYLVDFVNESFGYTGLLLKTLEASLTHIMTFDWKKLFKVTYTYNSI